MTAPDGDGGGSKEGRPLVLDASVILEGMALPQGEVCMVPPSVRDEVSEGAPGRTMEGMLAAGLQVREPSAGAVARVRDAASGTGDDARISDADVDCIALALEAGGVLVTDDYSMQNTAGALGVPWRGYQQRGITEEVRWGWRCRGCGRRFAEDEGGKGECPVCGSGLRQVRR